MVIRRDEFKGKGICRQLLERCLAICESIQYDKAYIAIYYKRKGLIKLCQSLGFIEVPALTNEYRRFEKK